MSFQVTGSKNKAESSKLKALSSAVLGPQYELSVAFLSPKEMREVTKRINKKDKVSNVLAFQLSKTSGEILICRRAAAPYTVSYLFIHGLLHLKGLKHSAKMEGAEQELLQRFSLHAKNSHRH